MSKQLCCLLVCTCLVYFAAERERTWADGPVAPKTSPTPEVSAHLQKLSNGELIDLLIHRIMLETALSQYEADLIPVDKRSNRPTGALKPKTPKAYAVMAELIRRGGKALPDLAERVTDKRVTDFVIGGKDIDGQRAYRLRVGDLCFEVIGKIVDQPMQAVSYTGGKISFRVVKSPIDKPELAKQVQKDWGEVSEEEYLAYLIERSSKFAKWSSWHKLRFYHPESTEHIAVQLLRRPTFDKSQLWSFIRTDLAADDDPKSWQVKIDNYLRENGDHLARQIPFWMHWIYWETDSARDESFLAKQKNAEQILDDLYPDFKPTGQARSDAAEINDHIVAITSLRKVPSKSIDAQVFKMLQDTVITKLSATERYKLTWLTEACLKRLYSQDYHAGGRSNALFDHCCGIIEKENSNDPIYDKEDPYNYYLRRVALSFLVKYEPKKSHQLFSDFQSPESTKTLSEKIKMLSEPVTVEPWMLDFLKEQLSNKEPEARQGFLPHNPVRICDRAAQIIARSYLEKPVQLEVELNPKRMDDQIAKLKRALAGEKVIEFGPLENTNQE